MLLEFADEIQLFERSVSVFDIPLHCPFIPVFYLLFAGYLSDDRASASSVRAFSSFHVFFVLIITYFSLCAEWNGSGIFLRKS